MFCRREKTIISRVLFFTCVLGCFENLCGIDSTAFRVCALSQTAPDMPHARNNYKEGFKSTANSDLFAKNAIGKSDHVDYQNTLQAEMGMDGRYALDKDKSDSIEPILEWYGLSWMKRKLGKTIADAMKLEITTAPDQNTIQQSFSCMYRTENLLLQVTSSPPSLPYECNEKNAVKIQDLGDLCMSCYWTQPMIQFECVFKIPLKEKSKQSTTETNFQQLTWTKTSSNELHLKMKAIKVFTDDDDAALSTRKNKERSRVCHRYFKQI